VRVALPDGQRLQSGQPLHGRRLRAEDAVTEAEYEAVAVPELLALVRALDGLDAVELEAELASDILTIEFADGARYVVNSHRAARQIWMAAELTAWHFDWIVEKKAWIAGKSGDELWAVLEAALSRRLKRPVTLSRP
jgi:CyaY protein